MTRSDPARGRRRLAPGTGLRDGLERILRGRTGALIVLGYDENVEGDLRRRFLPRCPLCPPPAA
ncbi:DNA integrity scanning DisA domain protein [Mycobacterium kansasii 662]|uniref:DNA integrity scanning DisA domain protein n=1 Tax=Mycobacterium kansasii 662 TaxID=1299326 RepID=X7XSY5_MYCKA|nr:DNA integrity scanning DisA domain protein [Mycobacterium kansasii 662]